MKKRLFLLLFFVLPFFAEAVVAKTVSSDFMTPQDVLKNDTSSNINLRNTGNSSVNVYGLYVRQLAQVTPGSSCDHPEVIYPTTTPVVILPNITVGSYVMPITIGSGRSAAVGANFLYSMIYQAEYYTHINYTSAPPGCSLPGCTWGDDTTSYNWCIYLGALSPVATTTGYTSTVPPSTEAASQTGTYDYNLVHNYAYLGPISCNDQTLTCTVANQQTQSF